MTRLGRYLRIAAAVLGVMLLGVGLTAAYWWFYKMAPLRHLADPEWIAAHSAAARWAEEQEDYRRLGSSPDLCWRGDRIGFYGDKKWFLWLEQRLRDPTFRHCGCSETALAFMSNQDDDARANWTEATRSRSQAEWIKDGFLRYNVTVHLPAQSDDTLPLLRLLGGKDWNYLMGGKPEGSDAINVVPSYVEYNAFRWLRDSGFEPIKFTMANAKLAAEAEISRGLQTFAELRASFQGEHGLGVLAVGSKVEERRELDMRPEMAMPWYVNTVNASIAVSTIVGCALIIWAVRSMRRLKRADKPGAIAGHVEQNEVRPAEGS
jgi:hypothetical protein